MAKSPNTGSDQVDEADQSLEDIDSEQENSAPEETTEAAETVDEDGADSDEATIEDGVTAEPEEAATDDDSAEDEPEPEADATVTEEVTDPVPEIEAEPQIAPAEKVVIERRGGFVPMALGGVAAAVMGYGLAWFQGGDDLSGALTAQGDRLSAIETGVTDLQGEVETLSAGPDLSAMEQEFADVKSAIGGVTGRLDAVQAEVSGGVAGLTDRLAEIDARLTDVEQRGTGEAGELAEAAIAAYEREVAALREEMQAQAAQLTAMTQDAESQLQAARDEILAAEEAAAAAAKAAEARAALGRVMAAVDTGAPFAGALADLEAASAAEIPAALGAAAADGVLTTAALQDSFADAARAALSAARDEGVDDIGGGLGGFLRSTFNARSVAPREGSDPDAVLSRVGAAVAEGRITDALAEADTLPEVVRAAMSDWLGAAQSRADALSALETLSQSVNDN